MEIKIKSALISVSDKSGLEPLIKKLHEYKVNIISTGGTARFIKELNIPVTDVSELTQFPEMMNGRIKTLHPNIHGGLLAIRDNKKHKESQDELGIIDIDLKRLLIAVIILIHVLKILILVDLQCFVLPQKTINMSAS